MIIGINLILVVVGWFGGLLQFRPVEVLWINKFDANLRINMDYKEPLDFSNTYQIEVGQNKWDKIYKDKKNYIVRQDYMGYDAVSKPALKHVYGGNILYIKVIWDNLEKLYHHIVELLIKSVVDEYMFQGGFVKLIKGALELDAVKYLAHHIYDVVPVTANGEIKYGKAVWRKNENDAAELNNIIDVIKDKVINNEEVLDRMGGDNDDDVALHLIAQNLQIFPYQYKLRGVRLNQKAASIKSIESLIKITWILLQNNIAVLTPINFTWNIAFDHERGVFKLNEMYLYSAARIEKLGPGERMLKVKNWCFIDNIKCGYIITIRRMGRIEKKQNKDKLLNNDQVLDVFRLNKRINGIIKPAIIKIEKQAYDKKTYIYPEFLLKRAMERIFKGKNIQSIIDYAVQNQIWAQNGHNIQFLRVKKKLTGNNNNNYAQQQQQQNDESLDVVMQSAANKQSNFNYNNNNKGAHDRFLSAEHQKK